jgi:hypothetical protein
MVSLCSFVDQSIVLDWAEFSILLFDKEEVGGVGTPGLADCSPLQVFCHKFVGFSYFILF